MPKVVKPAHMAGQSRGCSISGCPKEIPLSHRFCDRHHEKLTQEQKRKLAVLIRSLQHQPTTANLNAVNDFVRECCDHIRTAGNG